MPLLSFSFSDFLDAVSTAVRHEETAKLFRFDFFVIVIADVLLFVVFEDAVTSSIMSANFTLGCVVIRRKPRSVNAMIVFFIFLNSFDA